MTDLHEDAQRREKLKTIIRDSLRRQDLTDEQLASADLVHALGITSVDALEILICVEAEFNLHIPDEDLDRKLIESLDSLNSYVQSAQAPDQAT
jgi:acyl carrier protein